MSSVTGLFSFFLDKIINYLKLMEKEFIVSPEGIIVKDKVGDIPIEIIVIPTEKWVRILTKFDKIDDIPEERRYEFLMELLKATNDHPEISFGIDEDGYIVSIEDEYVYAFYFDVFEEEYTAVLASIEIYEKIKKKTLMEEKAKEQLKK